MIGRTTENPFFVLNETDTRAGCFVNRECSPRFVEVVDSGRRERGRATELKVIFIGYAEIKRGKEEKGWKEEKKKRMKKYYDIEWSYTLIQRDVLVLANSTRSVLWFIEDNLR